MEALINKSNRLIQSANIELERNVPLKIDFDWRLNGIVGSRGTGKTTKMLQHLKRMKLNGHKVLYVTLDDFYFAQNTPYQLALDFAQNGGQYLCFDEVHKLPNWSTFIKNIYDSETRLNIVFSGSSLLKIDQHNADLSRRALMYDMPGLSFREFLLLKYKLNFEAFTLTDLLKNHETIATELCTKITPLSYFKEYLTHGYYPFTLEKNRNYAMTLTQIIKYVLEVDFNTIEGYQGGQYYKLMNLLLTISQNPPFDLNISKVAAKIGINRNTLVNYLHYLNKANLTAHVNFPQTSMSNLTKPNKILLNDPNLYYTLTPENTDIGNVRESFFVNQLRYQHEVFLHPEADYQTAKFIFEIGGKNKKKNMAQKQLNKLYTVKDDIELGHDKTIPLYLFGFLY